MDAVAHDWAIALREQRRAMGAPTVAGVVNTLNEQDNLPDALRSLGWADEVIVVDMHSDDATREVAASFGARVETFERCGFVEPARNFAIQQAASFGWVMLLDADERIPKRLAEQLVGLSLDDELACVELPYANHLLGARLAATGWGAEYHPRFFRSGAVDWPTQIHGGPSGSVQVRGRVMHLPRTPGSEVEHHNIRDLAHFTEKTNRYTDKETEALAGAPGWAQAAAAARAEVAQRWSPGVDGTRSVALSVAMAFYRLLAHAKTWEERDFAGVEVPADAATALRELGSDAAGLRAEAIARIECDDVPAARELMRRAVADAVAPDLLSDLAVAMHSRGDTAAATALLRACLVLDPAHAGAHENLTALSAPAPAPPVAVAEGDVTAEWLDAERRPKPDPNYLITVVGEAG
jgi:hypothetical protein